MNMVRQLIQATGDVNSKDSGGATVLMVELCLTGISKDRICEDECYDPILP